MKKISTLFALALVAANAYSQEPTVVLTAGNGTVSFGYLAESSTIKVDWGDGIPVEVTGTKGEWEETYSVTGTSTGNPIKVYADGLTILDAGYVAATATAKFTGIQTSGAPELTSLSANTNELTAIDVSKNPALTKLVINGNSIASLDLSNCPLLTTLTAYGNALTALDLSANTALTTVNVNNNKITSDALILGDAAKSITTFYANNNKLSGEFDASVFASFKYEGTTSAQRKGYLYIQGNDLTSVILPETGLAYLYVQNNKMTFSSLPVPVGNVSPGYYRYNYSPQQAFEVAESYKVGETLDLSAENNVKGLADSENETTYTVNEVVDEAVTPITDGFTIEGGVITFGAGLSGKTLNVTMTSSAFPGLTLSTTDFLIEPSTGIDNIEVSTGKSSETYNLSGMRVNADSKGVVIKEGRKYLVK